MPRKIFHLECKANKAGNKGELMIYSSISPYSWDRENPDVTSRDFDKALKELGDVDEITVRINSPGGAVNEAVAIRTALMKHRAKKTIDIEGTCASAATIIACLPGARVRMAKGGDYMIHRSSWVAWGHADAMLSAYNSLINTDNDQADIYAERTGKTREDCLELMDRETWMSAEEAVEEGFADEILTVEEGEEPIAACAVDAETYELMKSCYAHVPENIVAEEDSKETAPDATEEAAPEAESEVSNERTAVAAGSSTENTGEESPENKGVNHMELREATAEMIQQENPEAAQAIAEAAITAERNRQKAIMSLKPKGAKWDEMARNAIENGDSEADFLRAVIAEQAKTGEEYLENRRAETAPAERIGAGDVKDVDGKSEEEEIQSFAREMAGYVTGSTSDNKSMF